MYLIAWSKNYRKTARKSGPDEWGNSGAGYTNLVMQSDHTSKNVSQDLIFGTIRHSILIKAKIKLSSHEEISLLLGFAS